jgi:uncharacterized short protein YbdD (DUF466 family)
MKLWLKISVSLLIIFVSLAASLLIKIQKIPLTSTGNFVLTIGSSVGVIAGIGLLFSSLAHYVALKKVAPAPPPKVSESFYSSLTSMIYNLWKVRGTQDFYKKALEYKGMLGRFKERTAEFFRECSNKTWLYFIEDSTKDYHIERVKKLIDKYGYTPEQVGRELIEQFIEHQKIKDPQDVYKAKKFGLMK